MGDVLKRSVGVLLLAFVFFGCSLKLLPYNLDVPAQTVRTIGTADPIDGRKRFREIFCELLARDGQFEAGAAGCDEQLLRLADEAPADDSPAPLPAHDTRYRVLIVPGLLGECLADIVTPFQVASTRLTGLGYRVAPLVVSGRSSADHNADEIAAAIRTIDPGETDRLILVGYSKGAVDILHFLIRHPGLAGRVDAVVSVAGAINGSPIAEEMVEDYEQWAGKLRGETCRVGDRGGIASLKRPVRLEWLAAHRLPPEVAKFSVVGFTEPRNTARVLRSSAKDLALIDPRNDGRLLFFDQVIPESTLLGYANADHFAIAIPFEDHADPAVARLGRGHAPYPRGVLLEAILLYVAESAKTAEAE